MPEQNTRGRISMEGDTPFVKDTNKQIREDCKNKIDDCVSFILITVHKENTCGGGIVSTPHCSLNIMKAMNDMRKNIVEGEADRFMSFMNKLRKKGEQRDES